MHGPHYITQGNERSNAPHYGMVILATATIPIEAYMVPLYIMVYKVNIIAIAFTGPAFAQSSSTSTYSTTTTSPAVPEKSGDVKVEKKTTKKVVKKKTTKAGAEKTKSTTTTTTEEKKVQ